MKKGFTLVELMAVILLIGLLCVFAIPAIVNQVGKKSEEVDAVMIGRAALGNPWLIKECVAYLEEGKILEKPSYNEKLDMIKKHYEILEKEKDTKRATLEIRSHALWYLKGLKDNKEIKNKIVHIESKEELFNIIEEYRDRLRSEEDER